MLPRRSWPPRPAAVYPEASSVQDGRLHDRRLRRRRAGARVRHARLRDGRGRPARARARVPRRAGGAPRRARRGHLRVQGLPGHRRAARCSPRRASACDVASGGELHLALKAGFEPGADLPARQREVRGGAARRGRGRRRLRSWSTTTRTSAKLAARAAGRRAPARAAADPPRRRRRHARGDPDRPRRVQVRPRPARGARAGRTTRPRTSTCAASTSTSAPSSTTRRRTARRSACSPGSASSRSTPSAAATRSPTPPTTGRPAIEESVARRRRGRARPARPGQAPGDRAGPLARRQRRRDALHGRVGQAAARRRADRRRRRRHVRQPAADALRRRLRGRASPTASARRASRRPSSASTASPATCWSAARGCPTPAPGDVLVTPVTGAYGHAMASNYNGVRRPPVVFCAGGEARAVVRRETYEDLRCPRRLGSACSATAPSAAAFAALLERARRRDRARHRPAPGAQRRAHPLARRLRGDPRRRSDLIVELMGGVEPARDYVLRAMRAGKHVVSANKQLLSQHGEELWACAREHGVQLRFEARGGRRRAGHPRAAGVARRRARGAHPRHRQRHDELHPHRDGARRAVLRGRARAGAGARLRRGRPDRRRHRPRRRGEDGDPRPARVRHAGPPRPGPLRGHRAHHRRTTSPTRSSSGSGSS